MEMKRVGFAMTYLMAVFLFSGVIFESKMTAEATLYKVGDSFGWTAEIDMSVWPRGKKFYAGDVLEFKYDYQQYDVRFVKKEEMDQCAVPDESPRYESGDDKVPLQFGANYFTTSRSEDCQTGMKIAINATSRPPVDALLNNRFINLH